MITFIVKKFNDLSTNELYGILQLRSEVFVVEQICVYQDIDDKDQKALHIIGIKNNKIVAYARLFDSGIYFKEASIGRVVIAEGERTFGYGHQLMKQAIKVVINKFNKKKIKISAQLYLKSFYESHGFVKKGESYLEDGIPHITMLLKL